MIPRFEVSPTSFILIIFTFCVAPILALIIFQSLYTRNQRRAPRGCRKLGLRIPSHLSDEFSSSYSQGTAVPTSSNKWRVKSLWIYPIKSCRGIELNRSSFDATGMSYDRQFMFAQLRSPFPVALDTPDDEKAAHVWEFITQRQFPMLARVRTELWVPDPSVPGYTTTSPEVCSGGVIVLHFPFTPDGWRGLLAIAGAALRGGVPERTVRIPFNPTAAMIKEKGFKMDEVRIWKDTVTALNMKMVVPDELKYFLGICNPFTLFRVDRENMRKVFRCAPKKDDLGWQPSTGFQDSVHLSNPPPIPPQYLFTFPHKSLT
jgi:hypothetical protein